MKKKIVWVVVSGVMVAALLLASCAPAVTEEEEVVAPPEEEEKVVTEEEVAPPPKGPQYGGIVTATLGIPFYGFDEAHVIPPLCTPVQLTHENLFVGDWSKGPAGTGEVSWMQQYFVTTAEVPCLCESWEMPDEETVVFHIRKGVHFHDKPPVNGREMTADDVAFTIERLCLTDLPLSFKMREPGRSIESVEATDKWTVVIKCNPKFIWRRMVDITEVMKIVAPEAGRGEFPGDYTDWETCIGTGPFMIVDEVPSSSLTFVKNPNYWRTDPVHPENTLPYVDGVNMLIIVDRSTRLAALRTGKIDQLDGLGWEDRESLVKTNPELQWAWTLGLRSANIGMRLDKPELPFGDIRVRRALAMGFDRQAIARDYYGGNAEVFAFPIPPFPEFKGAFRPLDEFSESIQEQFEYHPEKARQLLAEAGYPDGFKTEIICTATDADLLSIIKAMWADIGVDLKLDVKEFGVHQSLVRDSKHTQMAFASGGADPQRFGEFRPGMDINTSMIDDPFINDIYENKLVKHVWDWDTWNRVFKEDLVPYILENCWFIDPPTPYTYTFWQPWLKGYHGEAVIGNLNRPAWLFYIWLDQELKKEMGR